MMMKPRQCFAACALVLCALVMSGPAFASGGDGGFDDDPFVPIHHVPAPEFEAYAGGRLGVVSGAHWRVFQVLAWRSLHGASLSRAEAKGLNLNGWRVGVAEDTDSTAVKAWQDARARVMPRPAGDGKPASAPVDVSLTNSSNCPTAALAFAAQTLRDRFERYGAAGAQSWLSGQDVVFAACKPVYLQTSTGWAQRPSTLPPAAAPDAPAWLKADRAYQSAATLFYAGQYLEARDAFLKISADKTSPWQPLGAYLATRCLLRRATLSFALTDRNELVPEARALLQQAREELQAQSGRDPAAARLIGWVDARLRPQARAGDLGQLLRSGAIASDERVALLSEYLVLMDIVDNRQGLLQSTEPMTAWIGLMQAAANPSADATQRATVERAARERWKQDADIAWLLPLLAQARQLSDVSADELKAMRAVASSSPAWQTLHWHLARLELVSGSPAQADVAIDAVLADKTLAPSTRNRWLQLKLVSARSVDALLAAAPRTIAEPAGSAGAAVVPIPDETQRPEPMRDIGGDVAKRLYRQLPLSQLTSLMARTDLPDRLLPAPTEVMFTRALILEDWATADRLADDIARPRRTTQHLYRRYLAAAEPAQKRLAAALILVNTPELTPYVVTATGLTPYWGCRPDEGANVDPLLVVPVQFLSDAERTQAQRERAVLDALPIRTRWLATALLPWAATRPDDVEAPKALHLLVASTRMECYESAALKADAPNHSREAFELLHSLWPKSEWARKTKYWF